MIQFDLFIQTGYSMNGSLIDIDRLVKRAKKEGFKALGIADHNNMYGAIKFYESCHKEGIIPIIGMETTLVVPEMQELPFLLFAQNNQGYLNLMRITSHIATHEGNINLNNFEFDTSGLDAVILTTSGGIYQAILNNDIELATSIYRKIQSKFSNTYLGLDTNDFTVEFKIAPFLETIGKTLLVHQVLYDQKEDIVASKVLKNILKESHPITDGLFISEETTYEFKTSQQLDHMYEAYPNAIKNALQLIEKQSLTLDFTKRFIPVFPTKNDYLACDYLKALSLRGLEKRLQNKKKFKVPKEEYYKRLHFELDIIHKMEYDDYFLIVWDFVLYAKKKNILVGPGRGSAAGSLVAYVLGIVDVDPLDFDLYFERFLNPERITMPDIDMDFPDNKRDEVIQYVVNKYGHMHVTSIITFGTFQGKSALRDTAKVLGVSETIISEVTSYIAQTDNSITSFKEKQPNQYRNLMNNLEIKELFLIAEKLVDLPRHVSTHAAGIIITDAEITNYAPIQNGLAGMYQTQYEASDLEKLGLLKIDFLGLRNLTTIQNVLDTIYEQTNETVDIYKIDLENQKTYKLFQDVSTLGVFQLESNGMMNLLRKIQIQTFEDISTCIALFRPGPMESIPLFLDRRFKKEKTTYLDPDLIPILESTEGIIIYQEQIMKIANVYAGYSLGEADVLRRAVSKKKESILIEERKKFVRKCVENHHDESISNEIYDYIVKFANYGFNKSHSVVYSLVAYWMAYLKANYPAYFMATLLDASIGSQTATSDYIKECRKLNIKVLPPSVNHARKYYTREENNLRYPTLGIKNIGSIVADKIEEMRGNKTYKSFIDFMRRAKDINSRVIESMILVGMFDEFGLTKKTMIENLKQITSFVQIPSFKEEDEFVYIEYDEYDYETLQSNEKDLIGFNLRYHPINQYLKEIEERKLDTVSDIINKENQFVQFLGYLHKSKIIQTKNGDSMAFLSLEDPFSSVEAVLFPRDYENYKHQTEKNTCYIISGKLESRNNQLQVVIKSITPWEV